jgi:glyoxylase-like metal-dependent hydrolase (beta-lactamase superfamily II)
MHHILLPALNASTWTGPTGNNTYLLPGRVPTLVDAGVGKPEHIDAIARELNDVPLALVLITHGHSDHVGGLPAIEARWPDVRIRRFGLGEQPIKRGEQPITDDEVIEAGDGALTVVHTPGHSPDHCCFLDGGDLYCGDLVQAGATVVIPASRGGDLSVYIESLARVRRLQVRRLLPGHGPFIDNPDALIDDYVRHRVKREKQIFNMLVSGGSATVDQIVSRIYAGLAPALLPAATETVLAHLMKLAKDKRVTQHDGLWTREL